MPPSLPRSGTSSRTLRGEIEPLSPLQGALGSAAILQAVAHGDYLRAQGMLLAGADCNGCKDLAGRSVLHLAVAAKALRIVKLLLQRSADLAAIDSDKKTPLHLAAEMGNTQVMSLLLEARAAPDAATPLGETPLSLAVSAGPLEPVKMLLRANASCDSVEISSNLFHSEGSDITSTGRMSPNLGHSKSSDVTIHPSAGSSQWSVSPLLRAVERGAIHTVVEDLLKHKATVDVTDANQNQPLHLACLRGDAQTTRLLLAAQADPNCRNDVLRSPLHCAAMKGSSRVVKMLLAAKAEGNLRDASGHFPAQSGADPVTIGILSLLITDNDLAAPLSMATGTLKLLSPPSSPSNSSPTARTPLSRVRGAALAVVAAATLGKPLTRPPLPRSSSAGALVSR